ncbi:hypothetical protein BO71DRAFT_216593 [Aspergillus ellipticus CBS 707.79]|uniref:Uncharacterized protein n=1 Tax=Aspergillus ellipticus CBS 707.79 TaxID=1448320 RepID=A0A319DBX4_9EURO|nr:hypothetical protein BO71DRAFT_216593 [Aspergillus ellipticus CBS 707.79]
MDPSFSADSTEGVVSLRWRQLCFMHTPRLGVNVSRLRVWGSAGVRNQDGRMSETTTAGSGQAKSASAVSRTPKHFEQATIGCKSSNSQAAWRSLLRPACLSLASQERRIIICSATVGGHSCVEQTHPYHYVRMNARASSSRSPRFPTVIFTSAQLLPT